ncbi:hypothetical protein J437_LFUL016859 [Ladona fulva]|uniref:Uncharacterized protein n=1 Tax=Ladona fulva TaxID=123851 RepID=A0A8K0PAH8_LADFU|nr:hypothetical protein J437_LFUL016859 [Ladona fulva]
MHASGAGEKEDGHGPHRSEGVGVPGPGLRARKPPPPGSHARHRDQERIADVPGSIPPVLQDGGDFHQHVRPGVQPPPPFTRGLFREECNSVYSGQTGRKFGIKRNDYVRAFTHSQKAGVPEDTIKSLLPQAPVPPRLYGLPKVHEESLPLKLIVSAINSPTYLLARYLAKLHVEKSIHHVKNVL